MRRLTVMSSLRRRQRPLLLVGLDWTRKKDPPVSLASASIAAAVAQTAPVQCLSLNVNSADDIHAMLRQALDAFPHERPFIGLGAYIWAEHLIPDVLSTMKLQRPDATVVLGGPQVSYAPHGSFLSRAYPLADGFVRGFGEATMHALAQGETRPAGYHPAHACDTGSQGGKPSSMLPPSDLPSPLLTGWMRPQRFMRWETKRGCPFSCSFCQHKASSGKREALDAARILAECDWLCEQSKEGPLRDLAVVDPTFNQGDLHVPVLRRLAAGGLRGKLSLQCRLEMLTPEFIDAVNELRRSARVVLEFGVQTIHRSEQRHIERPNNAVRIQYWLDRLNAEGVPYELSFMYGLPAQTIQSFHSTVEWATRQIDAHAGADARALFFPLMLLRGTKLHENAEKLGLVSSNQVGVNIHQRVGSGIPHVVSSPSFSLDEWYKMNAIAEEINSR